MRFDTDQPVCCDGLGVVCRNFFAHFDDILLGAGIIQ